jgi:hypothetical protein
MATFHGITKDELDLRLFQAYRDCIRRKSGIKKTSYHFYQERELLELSRSLWNGSYRPGPSTIFVVTHPKPREVIAANFRDRVVHHLLFNYMAPFWERKFVDQSYACRKEKGPLRASLDLRAFLRRSPRSGATFFLKIDISSFFPSIDQGVLFSLIVRHLENDFYQWLAETLIFHNPTAKGQYRLNCSSKLWRLVPKHKSMFHAEPGKGLPIGNLTSQFFANVYLNEIDQLIAHDLKARYRIQFWQRYVDDLLFIGDEPRLLAELATSVDRTLQKKLLLRLNPRKTIIQPVSSGIDHLGYFHLPSRTYVRRRVARAAKTKISERMRRFAAGSSDQSTEELVATTNSYLGYFRQADAFNLRRAVARWIMNDPSCRLIVSASQDFTKVHARPKSAAKIPSISELARQFWCH